MGITKEGNELKLFLMDIRELANRYGVGYYVIANGRSASDIGSDPYMQYMKKAYNVYNRSHNLNALNSDFDTTLHKGKNTNLEDVSKLSQVNALRFVNEAINKAKRAGINCFVMSNFKVCNYVNQFPPVDPSVQNAIYLQNEVIRKM